MLLVLDVAVPDYDISPGILLPLLTAILALLGLEASALWVAGGAEPRAHLTSLGAARPPI